MSTQCFVMGQSRRSVNMLWMVLELPRPAQQGQHSRPSDGIVPNTKTAAACGVLTPGSETTAVLAISFHLKQNSSLDIKEIFKNELIKFGFLNIVVFVLVFWISWLQRQLIVLYVESNTDQKDQTRHICYYFQEYTGVLDILAVASARRGATTAFSHAFLLAARWLRSLGSRTVGSQFYLNTPPRFARHQLKRTTNQAKMSKLVLLFLVILAVVLMQSGVEACETLFGGCSKHEDCCSMWCAHSWLGDYCSVRN
ncbi:hypothetical protein MSG28_014273 [Choristoneura fumiferana]|uniref:Uncharacterized protein n=1 Tax=Choristoneura fumiferana TaxID=7141 RepID=A0ACC0JGQ0_CHOFU|nr:hypothetical protein MSG28_014273 [Choristoneura fumiferana]